MKNPKNASKAPTSDPILIIAVFERAVAVYARGAAVAGISLTKVEDAIGTAEVVKPAQKGKGKMKANEETVDLPAMQQEKRVANETIQAYKEAESGVWKKYASWMVRVRIEQADDRREMVPKPKRYFCERLKLVLRAVILGAPYCTGW